MHKIQAQIMDIDKEQNIVVRYIPQYIVIETRYKSLLSNDDQQQISKTTSSTNYQLGTSIQDINFDRCDTIDYAEEADDNGFAELKQIETFEIKSVGSVDIPDCNVIPQKRKNDSKASKLLNDWFLSHLHVSTKYKFLDKFFISRYLYRILTQVKWKKMP